MLLTDGNPNDTMICGVRDGDSRRGDTETIDLDAKLRLATEEISEDVLDILLDHTRSR